MKSMPSTRRMASLGMVLLCLLVVATSATGSAAPRSHTGPGAGPPKPFRISGAVSGLAPGLTRSLDLTLSNPNRVALAVTRLSVRITGSSARGCSPGNFRVTQYSGRYPLRLPARASVRLSRLMVGTAHQPAVGMRDLDSDQNRCKNVALTLTYSGTAISSGPAPRGPR